MPLGMEAGMVQARERRFLVARGQAEVFMATVAPQLVMEVYDRERPIAFARTTYLDTDDLELFRSCRTPINRRLRVREYAAAASIDEEPTLSGSTFLELKESVGPVRSKARFAAPTEVIAEIVASRGRRPADPQHPFGHGLEVYFWGLIVAIVLFGLGAGLSVYEGIHGLRSPAEIGDPRWSYSVLGVALVAEGGSWIIAYRAFQRRRRGKSWWRALVGSKDPTLFTPLAEDTAALAGIVVAFIGVFLPVSNL